MKQNNSLWKIREMYKQCYYPYDWLFGRKLPQLLGKHFVLFYDDLDWIPEGDENRSQVEGTLILLVINC